jgi:hypothetical protein
MGSPSGKDSKRVSDLTARVIGAGAGVDNAWEQKKLNAGKKARKRRRLPSVQCTLC